MQLLVDKLCYEREYIQILDNISFELTNGECLLLKGENGTGKTTLLNCIAGIYPVSSGEITLNDTNEPEEVTNEFLYIGHEPAIKKQLTVYENCLYNTPQAVLPSPETILEILKTLNLAPYQDEYAKKLSQGQQRRLRYTSLLLSQRKIWLLDEPLNALDAKGTEWLIATCKAHLQAGGMIILSSHQDIDLSGAAVKELRLSAP